MDDWQVNDLKRAAQERLDEEDWQAQLIIDLSRRHPIRMKRILRDMAWLQKHAAARGKRWAGT